MVYNRCVGTRYCSNNCPYKVRRFNFYLFSDYETPSLKLLHNPDVIGAQPRRDGEVHLLRAAHQRRQNRRREAGPHGARRRNPDGLPGQLVRRRPSSSATSTIPNSRVSKMKAEKRNYGLLEDLNTRPRTTYLATLRNPNPEWES